MAALRHAARRLCERSLQRRIFRHGCSPGRRPMSSSTVSGKPQTVAGPQDELRMEFEEKKQELFDLCVEMRSTGAFTKLSWKDIQNFRLTTHLAAQMEPRPHDSTWRMYRGYRTFHDFQYAYFCLGFLAYSFLGKDKKKDEENIEANILSDTVPATE